MKGAGITCSVLNLLDFYKPIRGNMRRSRSRAGSYEDLDEAKVIEEVKEINENVDFDDPKMIDFELLIKGLD